MLQQTQVSRVRRMFPEFLKAFPDVRALARAPLARLLAAWHGMGYNRRALALRAAARTIVERHGGKVPRALGDLVALPGVGRATAAGIRACAFDEPGVAIETNVRAAYIHLFFRDGARVGDDALAPLVEFTLDRRRPRDWYNALMDFGTTLKKLFGNPARRSTRHRAAARFEGSDRQIRGGIVAMLLERRSCPARAVAERLGVERGRAERILEQMAREGFVTASRGRYSLART